MDVVCDRCQTEYVFDDSLVSERGTTVKCTNCGHQFKIFRPPTGAPGSATWILRRPDGSSVQFDSLAVLQRWITDGRVTRSDQLSRNGSDWKTLGSIAELDVFFASVPTRGQPTAPAGPAAPIEARTGNTLRPPPSPGTPGTSQANPVIAGPPSVDALGVTMHAAQAPVVPTAPDSAATSQDRFQLGQVQGIRENWSGPDASQTSPKLPQPKASPPARRAASTMDDEAITESHADDDLDAILGRRSRKKKASSRTGTVVAIVVVAGAGIGAAGYYFTQLRRPTGAADSSASNDRIRASLDRAEVLLATATGSSYEEARELLTAVLATDPDEARLRAARAEALALSSERRRTEAEDLEANAARGGSDAATLRAQAQVIRGEVASGLDRARQDVASAESNAARVTAPRDRVRFERALADAARVLGERRSAQQHVAAARAVASDPIADLVAALLERDASETDAAVVHLRRLVDRDEVSVRAHLALGRILAQRGDASARAEAEAVLRAQGRNDEAQALLQAVQNRVPPFQSTDAPTLPTPASTPDASVAVAVVDASAIVDAATDAPVTRVAVARDYESLIEEADRALEDGQRDRARGLYTAALAQRSNGCEALTGLGYVELDRGSTGRAVSQFRHALDSNPGYGDAVIGMAEAQERGGNFQDALRSYRRYVSEHPGGTHARQAQNHIETIEQRLGANGGSGSGGSGGGGSAPTPGPNEGSGGGLPAPGTGGGGI